MGFTENSWASHFIKELQKKPPQVPILGYLTHHKYIAITILLPFFLLANPPSSIITSSRLRFPLYTLKKLNPSLALFIVLHAIYAAYVPFWLRNIYTNVKRI